MKMSNKRNSLGKRILKFLTPSYEDPQAKKKSRDDILDIKTEDKERLKDLEREWEKTGFTKGSGMGGNFRRG